MYCRAIATDYDGTAATDGRLEPEAEGGLQAARADGIVTLLVTGRVLEEIEVGCTDLSPFDAIVAENGAVVFFPDRRRTLTLGTSPPLAFLDALRSAGIPFHTGAVVVGTWDRHAATVLELLRRHAPDRCLAFNRGAMMVLPSGVNKATGVRRALVELGRSPHNLVAFGDAENDLSLFALAEVAIAAKGADTEICARADEELRVSGGAGVAAYVRRLVEQRCVLPTPVRHVVELGTTTAGDRVEMPASGSNVLIMGDAHSGKSWLAGVVAEQLLDLDYRLCIVDPEGDQDGLASRPDVLAYGHQIALPGPESVPALLRGQPLSLVLNLSALTRAGQRSYVEALLAEVESASLRTGLPHWIVIDEAHYFFGKGAAAVRRLDRQTGNFLLVTYEPSQLDAAVLEHTSVYLLTSTVVEEERYFVTSLLGGRGPGDLVVSEALGEIQDHRVGVLTTLEGRSPRWAVFTPRARLTRHTHHARKYANTRLPDDKAFYFIEPGKPPVAVAHNMTEFSQALETVPMASLRHHLVARDFSRWVAGALGDEHLAHCLRVVEKAAGLGATPQREELRKHVQEHYGLLD